PILVIDGQRGAGQIIGTEAMDLAIARARAHGVAVVALRQSHHLGRIGAYAEQCAEAGLVSLHAVNVIGHRPLVAPFGGRDVRLGTNPFCAGVPCPGQPPLILDMATSCIAYGKLRVAFYEGRRVEPGVLIDRDGRPTDDPEPVTDPETAAVPEPAAEPGSTEESAAAAPAPVIEPMDADYTARQGANVRAGASTDAVKVGRLDGGTVVRVVGKVAGAPWFAVVLADGTEGFVHADLLVAGRPQTAASQGTALSADNPFATSGGAGEAPALSADNPFAAGAAQPDHEQSLSPDNPFGGTSP
ncbi:MAG: hypothetical protein FJX36_14735, partial [Alphaproteobacteria bacterium]|nr:hypothetical protein [Alphaproteobacteria bacterium]